MFNYEKSGIKNRTEERGKDVLLCAAREDSKKIPKGQTRAEEKSPPNPTRRGAFIPAAHDTSTKGLLDCRPHGSTMGAVWRPVVALPLATGCPRGPKLPLPPPSAPLQGPPHYPSGPHTARDPDAIRGNGSYEACCWCGPPTDILPAAAVKEWVLGRVWCGVEGLVPWGTGEVTRGGIGSLDFLFLFLGVR